MEYYSVFESINRNDIIIHGTIDEISTVIDIEDLIVEMIECLIKEFSKSLKEILCIDII